MAKRSYYVSVVTETAGEREPHRGYIQLSTAIPDHEEEIKAATLGAYPDAVEYLPMEIPNRQYYRNDVNVKMHEFWEKVFDVAFLGMMLQSENPSLIRNL